MKKYKLLLNLMTLINRYQFIFTIVTFLFIQNTTGQTTFISTYNDNFRGNFIIIGNTLAQEAASGTPAPIVGTVGSLGTNTPDSAPDVFWRANSPNFGQAEANISITASNARSQAILNIPLGAIVRKAVLYWAAKSSLPTHTVTIERAGVFSQIFTSEVTTAVTSNFLFQDKVDVTNLVTANGSGSYSVSGFSCNELANLNDGVIFAGWSLVVIYELVTDTFKNFQIKDGLDTITTGFPSTITFSDFLVDTSGGASLGIIAYDGDDTTIGDVLKVNGITVSDGINTANNFFNSSRTKLGSAETVAGDLPQLSGNANSMSGIDMDVVDVSNKINPGQTTAAINFSTSGDSYYAGVLVLSTPVSETLSNADFNISDFT